MVNKKQQYIVQKYVVAESVAEAIEKSKKLPIHEVYISGSWFEKMNSEFNRQVSSDEKIGFKKLSPSSVNTK